ncbi:MAG: adenylyl-sulfate kinase [Bacteroidales bacterium]|nr:adenylyl-sulfate kinase [Tenuifilaceae bacterium]
MTISKVVWLTGLPSSGKTTLANALYNYLALKGIPAVTIDGDEFRKSISSDLGFSLADRSENVRRAAQMARIVVNSKVMAICSFVSPTIAIREQAKSIIGSDNFLEVHICTPLSVCMQRDSKGLYHKAKTGILEDFTGVSSPFEDPLNPSIRIDASEQTVDQMVDLLFESTLKRFL